LTDKILRLRCAPLRMTVWAALRSGWQCGLRFAQNGKKAPGMTKRRSEWKRDKIPLPLSRLQLGKEWYCIVFHKKLTVFI